MSCLIRRKKKTVEELEKEYEANALLEMANSKKSFEMWATNHDTKLFNHLVYIAFLEDFVSEEMIQHWKTEVLSFSLPIITKTLKKDSRHLDRVKVIEDQMMAVGAHYEDMYVELFMDALDEEIRKGDKMIQKAKTDREKKNIEKLQKDIKYVCNNAGVYLEKNRDRIIHFYEDFKEAARTRDEEFFLEAVDDYVNNYQ